MSTPITSTPTTTPPTTFFLNNDNDGLVAESSSTRAQKRVLIDEWVGNDTEEGGDASTSRRAKRARTSGLSENTSPVAGPSSSRSVTTLFCIFHRFFHHGRCSQKESIQNVAWSWSTSTKNAQARLTAPSCPCPKPFLSRK
jgi:hypothetical protein